MKLQYFGHLMQRLNSLEDPDAGKDWGQEKKGTPEDKMVGWHHRFNGHEFEQTLGDSVGQGSLVCCSSWGCKMSDMTELHTHTFNSVFSFSINSVFSSVSVQLLSCVLIHKKYWNSSISSNLDGSREYYALWNKSDRKRQMLHDTTYMWNLKIKTNVYTKTETDLQI